MKKRYEKIEGPKEDQITKTEFKKFYGLEHKLVQEVLKVCFGFEGGSVNQCHGQLNLIKKSEFEKALRRYQNRSNIND